MTTSTAQPAVESTPSGQPAVESTPSGQPAVESTPSGQPAAEGTSTAPTGADPISTDLIEFIGRQTKKTVTAEVDLFGSGLVSSLFAMQLVAYVESTFGVAVQGPDLKLANFRSVAAITELVLRLRGEKPGGENGG